MQCFSVEILSHFTKSVAKSMCVIFKNLKAADEVRLNSRIQSLSGTSHKLLH